jgi:hypothetical protein
LSERFGAQRSQAAWNSFAAVTESADGVEISQAAINGDILIFNADFLICLKLLHKYGHGQKNVWPRQSLFRISPIIQRNQILVGNATYIGLWISFFIMTDFSNEIQSICHRKPISKGDLESIKSKIETIPFRT